MISRIKREIPFQPMTPDELAAVGVQVFGDRWKSALARFLGLTYVAVLRMSQGKAPIERRTAIAVRCLRDHGIGEH